ncbi:cyclin-dependent protein kinase regulator [Naematelia encephala]|uniref:Cyclin-dependent protein kinase regulator n=1 Tax=Naematelia encephala TaxID=71784 RepID=A0A1Y2BLF3_9TREE|nr:cyclin-dependent protein kinase regulator [Naematelia encephala]
MPAPPHPLATLAQITSTPSSRDGIPPEVEDDLRVAGCMMIQEAGIMLKLPQSTMATAQVIFHRFYYVSSMASFGINDISVSALYLSSKLNETPIRLRDLINTYIFLTARIRHLLKQPADDLFQIMNVAGPSRFGSNGKGKEKERDPVWNGFSFEVPGFHDEVFWDWKDVIVASEMQILKRLGFNMQVDLPYSHVINYLKILDLVFEEGIAQSCWSILNDALLTPLYAIHPPHVLACASILLTTRLHRIPLPAEWYILFDTDSDELWSCCGTIMTLWSTWGLGRPTGSTGAREETRAERKARENRWRRAWILAESRRAVRKWVEEREKETGDAGHPIEIR